MAQKMTKFKSIAMISSGLLIALAFMFNLIGANDLIDTFLVVATVLTGIPIVYFSLQALKFKYMSIDLLVSIAIIGAIVIGEYVESSVVGFLFLFGSYLEARTLAHEGIDSVTDGPGTRRGDSFKRWTRCCGRC